MGGLCATGASSEERGTHTEDQGEQSTSKAVLTLTNTVMMIRHDCRACFGPSFADRWGFFVDYHLSADIHSYLDWVEYPKGDHVLEGHMGGVLRSAITSDGCYLFSVAWDNHLIKWDLRTNEMISIFETFDMEVLRIAHTSGLLIVSCADGTIRVLNDENYSLIRTMEGHSERVTGLSLNKRGTTLVSGSNDNTCRVWSVDSGECLREMVGHTYWVSKVLFAGDVIISASNDKSLRIWEANSGIQLEMISDGLNFVNDISLNCDSSMFVYGCGNGLTLFQYPSMEVLSTVEMYAHSCQFHPSIPSILAVSDGSDSSIRIYDTDTSEIIHIFKGHSRSVRCLQFSPDGLRLVSCSMDKSIRVWDVSRVVS